jgi:hypothetical protein
MVRNILQYGLRTDHLVVLFVLLGWLMIPLSAVAESPQKTEIAYFALG